MQPCNRIYYSTVHWRLNMLRAAYRSSSGALTVFADSGLQKHVVNGRSQVWVGTEFPLRFDYGLTRLNIFRAAYRSSSGALTVFAASGLHTHVVTGRKFYYKVASCWLFLLSHTAIHGSMNIKFKIWWMLTYILTLVPCLFHYFVQWIRSSVIHRQLIVHLLIHCKK